MQIDIRAGKMRNIANIRGYIKFWQRSVVIYALIVRLGT